jgi:hypothetical protein
VTDATEEGRRQALFEHELTAHLESWKAQESARMEHWRAATTANLETWRNNQAFRLEGFRTAVAYGQQAIRAAFLINGGAAAALLAFLGHGGDLAKQAQSALVWALLTFGAGVALATVATLFAFFGQEHMSQSAPEGDEHSRMGTRYRRYALGVGAASLGAFVLACVIAALGLKETERPAAVGAGATSPMAGVPAAAEVFNLRSKCGALGDAMLERNAVGSDLRESAVSHYDPKTNRCYVRLDVYMADLKRFNEYSSSTVYDGQTGELLAHIEHRKGQEIDGSYIDIPYTGDVHAAARARIRELMEDDRKQ